MEDLSEVLAAAIAEAAEEDDELSKRRRFGIVSSLSISTAAPDTPCHHNNSSELLLLKQTNCSSTRPIVSKVDTVLSDVLQHLDDVDDSFSVSSCPPSLTPTATTTTTSTKQQNNNQLLTRLTAGAGQGDADIIVDSSSSRSWVAAGGHQPAPCSPADQLQGGPRLNWWAGGAAPARNGIVIPRSSTRRQQAASTAPTTTTTTLQTSYIRTAAANQPTTTCRHKESHQPTNRLFSSPLSPQQPPPPPLSVEAPLLTTTMGAAAGDEFSLFSNGLDSSRQQNNQPAAPPPPRPMTSSTAIAAVPASAWSIFSGSPIWSTVIGDPSMSSPPPAPPAGELADCQQQQQPTTTMSCQQHRLCDRVPPPPPPPSPQHEAAVHGGLLVPVGLAMLDGSTPPYHQGHFVQLSRMPVAEGQHVAGGDCWRLRASQEARVAAERAAAAAAASHRLQVRGAEVRDILLSVARQIEVNEARARLRTAEALKHILRYLNYPVRTHPSQVLRDRMVTGEMHPTQAVGGPNFSAPSVLAHPAEFKNPSSFLKIYGDPMCANGMGAKTPLRGAHGNWVCTKCDCVNFPRRFRCNKCETYRDARGDDVVSSYARFVYEQHLRTYQAIGAKAKPVSEVPPECHGQSSRKKTISPFAAFRRQEQQRYPEEIAQQRDIIPSHHVHQRAGGSEGQRLTFSSSGFAGFVPTHSI
eukprot:GHVS01061429.1.p1 GENE.GHVS01061429.1~~GHVS01061429.1.p1  ORF type:complete len:693 (+),score=144.34 GHVS01061429.1:359-2437(+)